MFMKPSGKVELLIISAKTAAMPPFRTSWLYLVPPFTLQNTTSIGNFQTICPKNIDSPK
jgi:hypothetical protein